MVKPTVAVLMSTYNGEKYIKEQIDSILQQEDVDLMLFIRDDGSKDSTINIIKDYISKYKNIIFVNSNENVGPGLSFLLLLKHVYDLDYSYDYYAFADQDDIWLSKKLTVGIDKIRKLSKPALYVSNQLIYKDDKDIGLRYTILPDLSLEAEITHNKVSGCTFVFNKELTKQILGSGLPCKLILDYKLHDSWVVLVALVCGKVFYDQNAYIRYRIHDNNVAGLKEMSCLCRLKRFFNITNSNKVKYKNIRMITAKELLYKYSNMSEDYKLFLKTIAFYRNSLKNRIKLLKLKSIWQKSGENKMIFIMKVLLGYV